ARSFLHGSTRAPVAATRQPSDTPSVITRLDTAQRLRNVNAGAYSGDPYHASSFSQDGNSITTSRFGSQLPSSVSLLPPRARKRPPNVATLCATSRRYS